MNAKNKKFINVQRRVMACVLAVLTIFGMNTGVFSEPMIVNAQTTGTFTDTKTFAASDSWQTYDVSESAYYTIDVYGGAGGEPGDCGSLGNYTEGRGGHVKVTMYLTKGDILYLAPGHMGESVGTIGDDTGKYNPAVHTPGNENGAGSGGGGAYGRRAAAGGGASEVRLNGTDRSNLVAVAGGGGGGLIYNNKMINGGNAAASGSGNAKSPKGVTVSTIYGGGGGGGYFGGTGGTNLSSSHGGSNYVNTELSGLTVEADETNSLRRDGCINITRNTSYMLRVNPNGGIWRNTENESFFTLDETYTSVTSFSYTGSVQTYKAPYTGYYYLEAWGAAGGRNESPGGYGGYVKAYIPLTEGQIIYVCVGGLGQSQKTIGVGGYNGGGTAGNIGASGTGGGATHIALSNHGTLNGYANYKSDVLVVAGGGSGGSASSHGNGGRILYTGNGTNWPGTVVQGNSFIGYLNNTFAQGTNAGSLNVDGGGGGGGWVGGRNGLDTAGYPAEGGASFVNTEANCIPIGLEPNSNSGNGSVRISYMSDAVAIDSPTRIGYTFKGWDLQGSGTLKTTNWDTTKCMFTYAEGLSVLTAKWEKNVGYSILNIDPNGGYYQNINKPKNYVAAYNTQLFIDEPVRYGFDFAGWTYTPIVQKAQKDLWLSSESKYVYGYESEAKLVANWTLHSSGLTIDPNGGFYDGSTDKVVSSNLTTNDTISVEIPNRVGYIFQYWEEINGSDGYLSDDGWHPGTIDGYLKAIWEPITYTVYYEPNTPEGLTLTGEQPDQTHIYDQSKALATNAEYNDPTGYKIPNVKFLWWNTEPDGTGTTYTSGQVVKNLTTKQDDVITLYAQWMVTYTVEHYKENLDGTYALADTDEYKLVPLTTWTAPLHDYPGWSKPASEPFTVGTTDTTLKFYYPLIHYKLTYDTQGGEWYEEQSDGTWISVDAPPSEYTVLTPDIHVTRPDKVGYTFLGWTGTDVPSNTLDVVIPQGSLGDRSYTAHWEAQAYDVEVPVSVLFSVGYDGYASGVFDQKGDGNYDTYGYLNNNSLFPVQVTNVTFNNESDYVFTHDKTLDETNPNIMNWRLDIQNGGEWNQYAPELLEGIDTDSSDIFWMAQNGNGHLKMNVDNAWAIHNNQDAKEKEQLGRIVWTFGIGHRNVTSRSIATME